MTDRAIDAALMSFFIDDHWYVASIIVRQDRDWRSGAGDFTFDALIEYDGREWRGSSSSPRAAVLAAIEAARHE